jgi:hypothetical protein
MRAESFVRLTWENFFAILINEGVVRLLAPFAPVEAVTLLGEVPWSKAIEAECIRLDYGYHLVMRK